MFKVDDLIVWLGVSAFEMLVYLIAAVISTIVLVFQIDYLTSVNNYSGGIYLSLDSLLWIFGPLFLSDFINAYFCLIICIRMYVDNNLRAGLFAALWSFSVIGVKFLFEFLLYQKLMGVSSLDFSEVGSPIILLLQLIAVRACQTR